MQGVNNPTIFSLEGKKILVTGAAGHLGRALCDYLVADGATVYAVDFDASGLESLRRHSNFRDDAVFTFHSDLSSESDRNLVKELVAEQTDLLDGVVFAAALVGTSQVFGWTGDFQTQSLSAWRQALEVNLTAPFHLTQLFEPLLSGARLPSVVNVGSLYGGVAPNWNLYEGLDMANPAAYGASKGGLIQLTRWLASALGPKIRVNLVSPGGIYRNHPEVFVERYSRRVPLGRMASEDDIVGQIVFFLSDAARYVTGSIGHVDGGYSST